MPENHALSALWSIGGVASLFGLILTLGGPTKELFDPPDYSPVYWGVGLMALGAVSLIGALVVTGVGWYLRNVAKVQASSE